MALFQQRPQASDSIQLYTLGQTNTILIVGLGNIGREYSNTRHNIGFTCLDHFVSRLDEMPDWVEKKDLYCYISKGRIGDTQVVAIKPTTLMNRSGQAVQAVSSFYKIAPSHIVIVHDELDIPFGQIRLRIGGSSAGNNGIKSISQAIDEDYGRIRVGIGPKEPVTMDSAAFVLQKFNAVQQTQVSNLTKEVTAILTEYIYAGQLSHDTRTFLV
jgi:PTH1 family peptidyl-tRNA hydrolase